MRRPRSRALTVALVVVVVAVLVAGATAGYRYAHRKVPVVVDPACPALVTNTSDALQDFADLLVWQGRTYVVVEEGPDFVAGDEVGRVTCSIGDMANPDGLAVAQPPWPDGTATGLARGTVIRSAGSRALVAEDSDGQTLYCEGDAGSTGRTC